MNDFKRHEPIVVRAQQRDGSVETFSETKQSLKESYQNKGKHTAREDTQPSACAEHQ
jgi:hypothetical protein